MAKSVAKPSIPSRAMSKASRVFWRLLSSVVERTPLRPSTGVRNGQYAIGVVTYVVRFEQYFTPLITRLLRAFPDTQIIVAVNGYHDLERQRAYLEKLQALVSPWPNIVLIQSEDPQPLSRLLNRIVISAAATKVLILNDDIEIGLRFRRELEKSHLDTVDIAIINSSWSHFIIAKTVVGTVGWFDERLSQVGYEDHDYEARLALAHIPVTNLSNLSIRNVVCQTRDFSYGREIATVYAKYSQNNEAFYLSKWECSPKPRRGFVWVRVLNAYARLRPGMDTPDYYSDIRRQYGTMVIEDH